MSDSEIGGSGRKPEIEAKETVEENRDLFERIADADLPISDDIERVLELVDGGGD